MEFRARVNEWIAINSWRLCFAQGAYGSICLGDWVRVSTLLQVSLPIAGNIPLPPYKSIEFNFTKHIDGWRVLNSPLLNRNTIWNDIWRTASQLMAISLTRTKIMVQNYEYEDWGAPTEQKYVSESAEADGITLLLALLICNYQNAFIKSYRLALR